MNNTATKYCLSTLALLALTPLSGFADTPPETHANIETVIVSATRTEENVQDVPMSISVQNMESLEENGFTFGTDEFRGVPGISFRRGEGGGDLFPFVSFRGSPGTDGYLALVDGIPYVGVLEEAPLDQIPYSVVDRIEVVKGPGSTLYGRGAVYGLANYITKSPDEDESTLSLSAGSNGYARGQGSISHRLDNGMGLLLNGTVEEYDGWREQGGYSKINLFGKLHVPMGENTDLTAYVNYYDTDKQAPNGLPLDNDGNVIPVAGGRTAFLGFNEPHNDHQLWVGSLKLEHTFNDNLSFTSSLQLRRTERDSSFNFYDAYGFSPEQNAYAINGFSAEKTQDAAVFDSSFNWRSGRHNLVAGFSADQSNSTALDKWSGQHGFTATCGYNFFLIEIDYSTGEILNRDHPCFVVDLPFSDNEIDNSAWGIFVQDEIALTQSLDLTLGLRYDAFERDASFKPVEGSSASGELSGDTDALSPRVALSWESGIGDIYFSYGRGFNSNFGPVFEWNPANYARPENKPTTIDSFELGWKTLTLNDRLQLEMAIFQTYQKDRRSTIPNPAAENDYSQPSNLITYGQRYDSQGIELSFAYLLTQDARIAISASHINPEWDEYLINSYGTEIDLSGTTPVGVAENSLYVSYDHQVTSWLEIRAIYEFYDDYQITQDNRVSGGQYDLLTLGASIYPSWWKNATITLSALNVLDEEYYYYFGDRTAPTYAMPGTEREVRASLEFKW
ncbi:TonB-dependent receptor [Gilvimarinus agarilyticus]|uniref:TonB-dependent receptor n=1 Tax=Gilvimarinus sp. 2_MG-2023 TaxID=3062666 RepID=UPI001C09616B|nr:TonB-dependent receptor [Gilvimarinus sp. 2_MG-2023]MBU2884368.1 TonB-dependent receptor [Gilvimarinus agarilyticus]MDO6569504.1 TonB-dependent receptor [Gilvimarinus sp. 2_MG-2023]